MSSIRHRKRRLSGHAGAAKSAPRGRWRRSRSRSRAVPESSARPSPRPPSRERSSSVDSSATRQATRFTFRVDRLTVAEDGWQAEVGVTNGSESAYRLGRGSVGLVLLDTATRAELERLTDDLQRAPPALMPDRLEPEPPPVLGPGASWEATIGGSEVLRQGSVVRVLFGPYSRLGARDITQAGTVLWVTDHAVRL
jgi:hypothetical protein